MGRSNVALQEQQLARFTRDREELIGLIEQVERYLEERAEVVDGPQGVVIQNWAAEMLGVFHGRFQWARALHLRGSI
jgi:hypothetical protein